MNTIPVLCHVLLHSTVHPGIYRSRIFPLTDFVKPSNFFPLLRNPYTHLLVPSEVPSPPYTEHGSFYTYKNLASHPLLHLVLCFFKTKDQEDCRGGGWERKTIHCEPGLGDSSGLGPGTDGSVGTDGLGRTTTDNPEPEGPQGTDSTEDGPSTCTTVLGSGYHRRSRGKGNVVPDANSGGDLLFGGFSDPFSSDPFSSVGETVGVELHVGVPHMPSGDGERRVGVSRSAGGATFSRTGSTSSEPSSRNGRGWRTPQGRSGNWCYRRALYRGPGYRAGDEGPYSYRRGRSPLPGSSPVISEVVSRPFSCRSGDSSPLPTLQHIKHRRTSSPPHPNPPPTPGSRTGVYPNTENGHPTNTRHSCPSRARSSV